MRIFGAKLECVNRPYPKNDILFLFAFSGQFPKGILRFGVVLLANKTESYFDEEE